MLEIRTFTEQPDEFHISTDNNIILSVEFRDDIEYIEESNMWMTSCYYIGSMSIPYSKHVAKTLLIRCKYSADAIFDISLLDPSDPQVIRYKQYTEKVTAYVDSLPDVLMKN